MKNFIYSISLSLLSWVTPITWKEVMKDFNDRFYSTRFRKNALLIREDYQNKRFDTTCLTSQRLQNDAWLRIHSLMGRCDYIVVADSSADNCFFIYSDKAYAKFWVKYDKNDKISTIRIIRPAITEHLIPPPCGY